MADYCIQILSDCTAGKRLGRAGRKRAMQLFNEDLIIPQYEAVYRRLIE
jgi:glycosyltransferase involved in cell wall biosynthesis